MAIVDLPTSPSPREAVPRLLDWGGDLVPPLGGPVQRLVRMGSRFSLEVAMPPLETESVGRIWVSRLRRGKNEKVRLEFPQPDLDVGSPGSPTIATAASGGTSIALAGLTAGYTIREGQFLSVVHGGKRYLYSADADVTAVGGAATVAITPMLRTPVSVGDVVELNPPKIEGYVEGDEVAWTIAVEHFTGLSFTIVEAE